MGVRGARGARGDSRFEDFRRLLGVRGEDGIFSEIIGFYKVGFEEHCVQLEKYPRAGVCGTMVGPRILLAL